MDTLQTAQAIVAEYRLEASTELRHLLDALEYEHGVFEPGWGRTTWCIIGEWHRILIEHNPQKLRHQLLGLGLRLLERDEWIRCSVSNKLYVRYLASPSWRPSYIEHEGEIYGIHHVKSNPDLASAYLQSLEGVTCDNDTPVIVLIQARLDDYGYKRITRYFSNGLFGDQRHDPKLIHQSISEMGINRFLFRLTNKTRFSVSFSVWIHENQWDNFDNEKLVCLGKDPREKSIENNETSWKLPFCSPNS